MHSQNNEAEIILKYFNGRKGHLLDIGANDGETFSNSRDLMLNGWTGSLLEPSPTAFAKLEKLYKKAWLTWVYNFGIAAKSGVYKFHESGAHVPNGQDVALVSSTSEAEIKRWKDNGVQFRTIEVNMESWNEFATGDEEFNFITIDAEGSDWYILKQINLKKVKCECLCIEWNSKPELLQAYTTYVQQFGLKEIHRNAENIIYAI